jgi:hypothetical protein
MHVTPLLHACWQQSAAHSPVLPTKSPVATQLAHMPVVVSQAGEPATDVQSLSLLHSTHVPAMALMEVLAHTWALGSPADVQVVPVGASVKQGVSGEGPQQAGSMRQALVEVGRLAASSAIVLPPLPSHTSCWQVPANPVWSDAGATVLPG